MVEKTQSKISLLNKILTDILKSPACKDTLFAYFGPCMAILDIILPPEKKTSLEDISKKLDDINTEIQGKITKEAERIISAMDAIPDIIDVRNAKRNITSLKKSIENAQNNIGVDLDSSTKNAEQKLRAIALELGADPKEWGLCSTINGTEVLAEDITVRGTDVATAIETNSLDNLYVSMYRYQSTKSVFSGEAIDKSADFINSTYGIYLNCATTVLQYLNAKAQIAVIDNDEDMLKKVDIKIDSIIDDMTAAAEAVNEFFSLNRLIFVGGRSDAGEHIRLNKELGAVNYKKAKVEDIDAVFKGSALNYDEVGSVIAKAKATGAGSMAEFLKKAGFTFRNDGGCCLITGKGYKEGGTISVPYSCLYKGVELGSASLAADPVLYYQYKTDRDSQDIYDEHWFDGNAMFFRKDAEKTYEFTDLTANDTLDSFTAYLRCKETGEVIRTNCVTAVRTDNGEDNGPGPSARQPILRAGRTPGQSSSR